MRPTLIVSLPLAWTLGRKERPAVAAAEALRKFRRWEPVGSVIGSFSGVSVQARRSRTMLPGAGRGEAFCCKVGRARRGPPDEADRRASRTRPTLRGQQQLSNSPRGLTL